MDKEKKHDLLQEYLNALADGDTAHSIIAWQKLQDKFREASQAEVAD